MKIDFYDPSFLDNPYPTYVDVRSERAFFDETWDLTFFTRHSDVSAILKDRRFGRDFHHVISREDVDPVVYERTYPSRYPTWTRYIRNSFIDLEPPRHTRIRRLVAKAFSRRQAEEFRPHLEQVAEGLLDRALAVGHMEAISEYAVPIPLTMISELMGIPDADRRQLIDWSHAIVRVFDHNCTPEEGAAAEQAVVEFVGYLKELLPVRRRKPGIDLISSLLQVEDDGDRLGEDDVIASAILVLNAGHEATVHAIGNSLLALSSRSLRDLKEADIALAASELLRYDSPLQMFERWVLEDLEWAGVALRRGTKVGLLFGCANHDPDRFSEPHRLDLGRTDNPHLSFGAGIHYCVGAPLAQVELEVALAGLSKRVQVFEVDPTRIDRAQSFVFRGVKELHLELS